MKSKFQVGDKVAVYDGLRLVGTIVEITKYCGDTAFYVRFEDRPNRLYHHKQLRKLVKKEPREWDCYLFGDGTVSSSSSKNTTVFGTASTTTVTERGTPIRVREIRGKGK